MCETHRFSDPWDNRVGPTEDDAIVLPFSPLLEGDGEEGNDAWWDTDEWFMPQAEPPRPQVPRVACDKCGGNMAASPYIPGLITVACIACSKSYEALESDFEEEAGPAAAAVVLRRSESLLWERS